MVLNFKLENVYDYSELIKTDKIQAIFENMPNGLTKMEKAYNVYIELGKIVSRDPNFFLGPLKNRIEHYNDNIDDSFLGICKSILELYVTILKDKRIGVEADLIRKHPDEPIGNHVEAILKIDDKNYVVDLISDLVNIKTNRRLNNFAKNLEGIHDDFYNNIIEEYGELSHLSRAELERMDLKLKYSYGRIQSENGDNERGIYTNDVFHRLEEELKDPEKVKKYIIKDNKIKKADILDFKIKFLCEHMDDFIETSENLNGIELSMAFDRLIKLWTSGEEYQRLHYYEVKVGETNRDFISILKARPLDKTGSNTYYLYTKGQKTYRPITMEEIKEYLGRFDDKNISNLSFMTILDERPNNKETLTEELER